MSQEASSPSPSDNSTPADAGEESFDQKPAGHQPEDQKDEVFEPGVEG